MSNKEKGKTRKTDQSGIYEKIVYKDLDIKLGDLLDKRQSIIEEVDSKYKAALDKYGDSSISSNTGSEGENNE